MHEFKVTDYLYVNRGQGRIKPLRTKPQAPKLYPDRYTSRELRQIALNQKSRG